MPPARSNPLLAPPNFRKRDWFTLGVLAVLACVVFAGVKYAINLSAYNTGHAAYQQADCQTAVDAYQRMDMENPYFLSSDVIMTRSLEYGECRAFMKSLFKWEHEGKFNTPRETGDSLIAFTQFVNDYHESPVTDAARDRIATIYSDTPAAELAKTLDLCQAILNDTGNFVQGKNRDKVQAELLVECGLMYRALDLDTDGQFCNDNNMTGRRRTNECAEEEKKLNRSVGAVQYFNTFLSLYPDHPRKAEVEAVLVDELNLQAEAFDTAELPQPDITGHNSSDKATIVIQNGGPDAPQLAFNNQIFVLQNCAECKVFTKQEVDDNKADCVDGAPLMTLEFEPDVYHIIVSNAPGEDFAAPYRGTWKLEAGTEYFSCFFVANSH